MTLRAAADAAALVPDGFADDLRNLQARGRCAKLAADTVAGDHITSAVAAVAWRLCPPPTKRLAVHNPDAVRAGAAGTAAWSGRDLELVWRSTPRSTLAAAAASTSGYSRNVAAAGDLCPPAILAALAQTNDWRTRAAVARRVIAGRMRAAGTPKPAPIIHPWLG